jgi:membrane protein implicated in regulation of membrane protease activity
MFNQPTKPHLNANRLSKLVGKRFRAASDIDHEGSIVDFEGNQIPALSQERSIPQNDIIEVTEKVNDVGVIVRPVVDDTDIIEMI